MKPKPYRKTKKSKGSNISAWNPEKDTGGGEVKGVIKGPMSSIGTCATNPETDQGMSKGIEKI